MPSSTAFCWAWLPPPAEMNDPKLTALPNSPSQTAGCISDISSWYGFVYHFFKSLFVRAHSPCNGLVLSLGIVLDCCWASCGGSLGRSSCTVTSCKDVSLPTSTFLSIC